MEDTWFRQQNASRDDAVDPPLDPLADPLEAEAARQLRVREEDDEKEPPPKRRFADSLEGSLAIVEDETEEMDLRVRTAVDLLAKELSEEQLQRIERAVLGRAESDDEHRGRPDPAWRPIRSLLSAARKGGKVEAKRARRQSKAPRPPPILAGGSDSESSSEESDMEVRSGKQRMTHVPVANPGHVWQPSELGVGQPTDRMSGLNAAGTWASVYRDGNFVPRRVGEEYNVDAHRRRPPEEALMGAARERLEGPSEERDAELRRTLQYGYQDLLFPSGQPLDPEEIDEDARARQDAAVRRLRDEEGDTPVGALVRTGAPRGLRTSRRAVTQTDSEQRLLASHLWQNMTRAVIQTIGSEGEVREDDQRTFHIALNRSSCRGCANILVGDLVDFWTQLDEAVHEEPLGWRATKEAYKDRYRFKLSFTVEFEGRRKGGKENFAQIDAALKDAGWQTVQFAPLGAIAEEEQEEDSGSET